MDLPLRQNGEDIIDWLERVAAAKGWPTGSKESITRMRAAKAERDARLPYKDPDDIDDRGDDPNAY
jgi:hypothetical protein